VTYKQPENIGADAPGEEALVEAARTGSEEAFVLLARRYEHRLYAFACRMTGNASDAEDIVQETLVRVYRYLDRFKPGAAFKPWVYQITANLCRDRLRRARRLQWVSMAAGSLGLGSLDETLRSADAPPDRQAAAREELALAEQALAALPEKQRMVILMTRYEGMSYEDAAAALGIPVGTVKSRLNAGIARMIKTMEKGAP
jgi:RNA polymerase sigma-70 factor, ECF subfamily